MQVIFYLDNKCFIDKQESSIVSFFDEYHSHSNHFLQRAQLEGVAAIASSILTAISLVVA